MKATDAMSILKALKAHRETVQANRHTGPWSVRSARTDLIDAIASAERQAERFAKELAFAELESN